ncbi:GEVED domain-containing protein [Rubripirellula obstinata]|uniref:GEVED domain-containing protein n=1 Tax=Rubripirellula obstinata TaxID=406547 RepID=UPI00135BC4B7|nr:G8 domain-containing protein [Rubripirellula obstinata]
MKSKQAKRRGRKPRLERLESRQLLAATLAVNSGDWTDASTWSNGVPTESTRAIISQGRTVTLNSTNHVAEEIVVHGQLVAEEGAAGSPDKSLTTRWIHVNSGGVFQIGTENNRYDNHDFVLTLTGTNPNADHVVETAMGTMQINDNDGFLMTGGGGSLQFFGDEKLSFTKLARTAFRNSTTITVENVIERNFDGTTSAASDGSLTGSNAWEVGDEIVIASSSYDYSEEDARTITAVNVQGSETVLTLNQPLSYRHYGQIETYKNGQESIDLRVEVALLNRSIVVQGTQDTDSRFGNRARYGTTAGRNLGIGAHAMFMTGSGNITIDSVQFDKMGQTGQVGRYPIHWHLGADRSGDVLRNSSVTNSNNRGVIVHGTQGLLIEGNVLHDIHGHGLFMEDGAEFDNQFLSNIVLGIHKVGGNSRNDPFIIPGVTRGSNGRVNDDAPRNGNGESSHDTGQQVFERFLSSAAYWITNPNNTWIGNISAGSEGTGFWFILPDRVIGHSRDTGLYNGYNPSKQNLGIFDHNTSHSSPVGLTFDRGSDIRGGGSVGYTPPQRATFNEFTGYKHNGTAVYHRGNNVTFAGSQFADVKSGSFNTFSQIERDVLFVGHSRGNASLSTLVGGYKLYDGPGQIIGAHFAGFAGDNAHTFLNTGGAHKHAMTRAEGITFEDDGTADNLSIYWQDAGGFTNDSPANAAGRPDAISGIVLDVDGSLTGHAGGGAGHVLTPRIDYYRDSTDIAPAGWNAYISDDRFGYLQLNTISGAGNFPYFDVHNGDDNRLRVNRRNITRQRLYTKLNAGDYTFTFTQPVPSDGFTVRMDVLRGAEPGDSSVYRFKGVGTDYEPTSGAERTTLQALRNSSSNAYFRDAGGDLWMKVFESGATIRIRPTNEPLPSNDAEVEALVLVNADNEEDIIELVDGLVINLTTLPTENFNVRAATNETTQSVGFNLTGPSAHSQTESIEPYSLFGDANGDFQSEPLLVGQYTLVVTPYDGNNLSGTAGEAVTINFTVTEPVQSQFASLTEDPVVKDGTLVRAEEFDEGGQGVAYFDTSPGNAGSGNNARPDEDVDLTGSSILLGNVIDGEWLEFTRDVVAGVYDIGINVNNFSIQFPEKGIRLLVAENAFSDSFTELGSVRIPDPNVTGTSFVIPDVDLTQWGGEDRVFRVEFFAGRPDIVIAPANAVLTSENSSYLDAPYGANGENWFNGSGLDNASDVETGDPVPEVWPGHQSGNHRDRVSRIRSAVESNTLTIDLGGTFDISGMVLWNSTESGQTARGFENTVLSYLTDGGTTFSGNDSLTWTQLEGGGPDFGPEVQSLAGVREGVTHVRMVVDNFSNAGSDAIVMASEFRFIGKGQAAAGSNLSLNFDALQFNNAHDLDFGDAPVSYSTLLSDDGARHAAIGPQLGSTRDSENDGSPSVGANGDGNDEDGVMFGAIAVNRSMAGVNFYLEDNQQGLIDAWIDFNRDGDWDDPFEQILSGAMVNQNLQTHSFALPDNLTTGDVHARVRISTDGGLGPQGFAADGEVEDYVVSIVQPPTVESIEINAGDAQRSSVDSVRVTFDQEVDIDTTGGAPFELIEPDSGAVVPILTPVIHQSGGKTIVDLTFQRTGPHVTAFGSLQDGDYQLTINPSLVTYPDSDVQLEGDHVMSAVDGLFRKYGDADGDNNVGLTDFAAFRSTFGKSAGEPGYVHGLDSDGDEEIGLTDFAAFRANFGT